MIRNILAPCSETKCVFFRIVRVFGTQVVGADGRLDRTQLASGGKVVVCSKLMEVHRGNWYLKMKQKGAN